MTSPVPVVRAPTLDDVVAMGHVFVDSFHAAHREQMPEQLLATRTYEVSSNGWARTIREGTEDEHVRIAELDGAIVGVGMAGPPSAWPPDDEARTRQVTGECYALYVHPASQRKGVGRALVRDLGGLVAGDGATRFLIGVLSTNAPARAFYERIGGRVLGERKHEDEGVLLDETVYVWDDIRALLTDASA